MLRSGAAKGGIVEFLVERSGRELGREEVPAGVIGIPSSLEAAREFRYAEPTFNLPSPVLDMLESAAGEMNPDEALWLQFAFPIGNLPLVPWERLLQPVLYDKPFLRLPYFATQPVATLDVLDIALCVSAPQAEGVVPLGEMLDQYIPVLQTAASRPTRLHLFVDSTEYLFLEHAIGGRPNVVLYPPETAGPFAKDQEFTRTADQAGQLQNPWLRWMAASLQRHTIDVVHFLVHGHLSRDQSWLLLAESPLRNLPDSWVGFVGPQEIAALATTLGAWAVGFTAPPRNYSPMGLRLLADQTARARPGPVFLHDADDSNYPNQPVRTFEPRFRADDLRQTYKFLFGMDAPTNQPPATPAVSLYCHPAKTGQTSELSEKTAAQVEQFYLIKGGSRPSVKVSEKAPAWVASGQRYLEQSVAQYLEPEAVSSRQMASQQGAEEALRFLSDVLERHAFKAGVIQKSDDITAFEEASA